MNKATLKKLSHINRKGGGMDHHYFLVCPVNSQNEEKLAGQGEARLRLLTNATYLAQAVDMHQFI